MIHKTNGGLYSDQQSRYGECVITDEQAKLIVKELSKKTTPVISCSVPKMNITLSTLIK